MIVFVSGKEHQFSGIGIVVIDGSGDDRQVEGYHVAGFEFSVGKFYEIITTAGRYFCAAALQLTLIRAAN